MVVGKKRDGKKRKKDQVSIQRTQKGSGRQRGKIKTSP